MELFVYTASIAIMVKLVAVAIVCPKNMSRHYRSPSTIRCERTDDPAVSDRSPAALIDEMGQFALQREEIGNFLLDRLELLPRDFIDHAAGARAIVSKV